MAITQRHIGILFCQQEGDLLFLIELLHDFADFFNQSRRRLSNGVTDTKQLLKTVGGAGYMLPSEVTQKGLAV